MVEGLESTVAFPLVTAGLFERGFGSGDVAKIMGGNFLRVMQQAWAPGARS
jgi:microsomal dipeptidase-like Zn-dependent dipeptidase